MKLFTKETLPFANVMLINENVETISDLTLTYWINHLNSSSLIAFQVKNIFGRQYLGKKYNLQTREFENDFFTSPVPFVSYKIEF